jgi:formylglycine-generating enzyme required for sulfatase activity
MLEIGSLRCTLYPAQVESISLPEFQMPSRPLCWFTILAASCAITTPLFAQNQAAPRPPAPVYNGHDIAAVNATIERFGFDFVTVGAPGNRSWLPHERQIPNGIFPNLIDDRGRVDYSYRIMRTEVVQTQYVDFVRAFRPFWLSIDNIPGAIETGSPVDSSFTSRGISIFGGFDVDPRFDNSAVTISWRNAARYANWLHHGAPTDPSQLSWDTFSTGAYTFTAGTFTGTSLEPITRNAGARFWLPGLDELLKAAYYDPSRYGEGEEGYWPYPNGSTDAPWFGAPPPDGDGDWGNGPDDEVWEKLTVGRYPHTVSPWGLLDVIGTATEWTETPWGVQYNEDGEISFIAGRTIIGGTSGLLDAWADAPGTQATNAFRLATIVPAPGGFAALGFLGLYAARRRR